MNHVHLKHRKTLTETKKLGNFLFVGSLYNERPCLVNIWNDFPQGYYYDLRGVKSSILVTHFPFLRLKGMSL